MVGGSERMVVVMSYMFSEEEAREDSGFGVVLVVFAFFIAAVCVCGTDPGPSDGENAAMLAQAKSMANSAGLSGVSCMSPGWGGWKVVCSGVASNGLVAEAACYGPGRCVWRDQGRTR